MTQNRYIATVVAAICLISLAACGGGGGGGSRPALVTPDPEPTPPRDPTAEPSYHLNTARFTTHQPKVLEQIGAHHAYARGLTGSGVRIGIDDSIVDYTQSAEFGDRVRLRAADGARLAYLRPDGDRNFSDVHTCVLFDPSCSIWEGNSAGNPEAVNSWVRQVVDRDGWPTGDDSVFVVDQYWSKNDPIERLLRWSEVPTPYGEGEHGTIVASVAAGQNLGVAPAAQPLSPSRRISRTIKERKPLQTKTLRGWQHCSRPQPAVSSMMNSQAPTETTTRSSTLSTVPMAGQYSIPT